MEAQIVKTITKIKSIDIFDGYTKVALTDISNFHYEPDCGSVEFSSSNWLSPVGGISYNFAINALFSGDEKESQILVHENASIEVKGIHVFSISPRVFYRIEFKD